VVNEKIYVVSDGSTGVGIVVRVFVQFGLFLFELCKLCTLEHFYVVAEDGKGRNISYL